MNEISEDKSVFGFSPMATYGLGSDAHNLMSDSLRVALTQDGVREVPMNSNSGPEVDAYLRCVNAPVGSAWCAAFTSWCIMTAEGTAKVDYPHTAWTPAIWQWAETMNSEIKSADVIAGTKIVPAGALFLLFGKVGNTERVKHVGFVNHVSNNIVHTIEGNTNKSGSREGGGVYQLERPLSSIYGFVTYKKS